MTDTLEVGYLLYFSEKRIHSPPTRSPSHGGRGHRRRRKHQKGKEQNESNLTLRLARRAYTQYLPHTARGTPNRKFRPVDFVDSFGSQISSRPRLLSRARLPFSTASLRLRLRASSTGPLPPPPHTQPVLSLLLRRPRCFLDCSERRGRRSGRGEMGPSRRGIRRIRWLR